MTFTGWLAILEAVAIIGLLFRIAHLQDELHFYRRRLDRHVRR